MFRDSLPPVLYLQMDNCVRENQKKSMRFSFLLYAGGTESVQKIKLGFLMVGHTHKDVDQFFPRFSKRLAWNPAKTVSSLIDELEKCYNPKPTAISLDRVYKIKEWLSPCISRISFHAGPHQFKIELNNNDKAVLVYKKWSTDSIWET